MTQTPDHPDKAEIRVKAVRQLLTADDIEQLYARDQDNLEKIKKLADTQMPTEIEEAISMFLSEFDVEVSEVEILVKPVLKIVFVIVRCEGYALKRIIKRTKVEEWLIEGTTQDLGITFPSAKIYQSSCHECDEKFESRTQICPSCSAQIIEG